MSKKKQTPKVTLSSKDAKALQEFLINAKASDKQQATLIKACNKLGEVPSLKKLNEMLKKAK